ncbi:C-type lectin domain-containing protein [Butyrivibrio sp. XBB1001]|uniref:C-type lectin domain-containing protein n=1 Tax=Butyrivibrio sp. XBB1001 TaxID=1280682 RepID=UPI00040EC9DA|nr:C-type lectin domain-containing protein [Butyrivibrio sp. XBB1001]
MKRIKQCMALLLCPIILSACAGQAPEEPSNEVTEELASVEGVSTIATESSSVVDDTSAEASEKVTEETSNELTPDNIPEWSKAYAEYLRTGAEYISFADGGSELSYTLIYLDDDDIPELFVDTGIEASGQMVITYYDGKIVEQYLSRIGSQYIEKSGLIYTDTGHMDYYPISITKLENGVFTEIASGIRYVSEEDFKKMGEDENYPYTLTYEWGDETVTEEEFNAHVAEYYDVDKGKQPNNYYLYDEFLYLLENGKWYSADHKYELIVQDCSWNDAQKICLEKGGYLATVTCTDEAKVISELIKEEGHTDKAFFVGYRSCEWVGDTFCSFRWINKDGSYQEVMPSMYDFWDYHSPGYDYTKNEWSFEGGEQEVGLAKFFEEDGMIYIFDAPDRILNVSPEYAGKLGFVCEYD